jgi:hypothetical protein
MNKKTYTSLQAKIGNEGAKQAVKGQRFYDTLALITLAFFVFLFTGNRSHVVINVWALIVFAIIAIAISTQMKLASMLSIYLNTKVHWYEIPQANHPHELDRWLAKKNAKRDL